MPIIFKAKTNEGHHLKVLSELLQNNIKTASFEIDSDGIRLRMTDSHRRILINLELASENFQVYKFKGTKMHIGLNLNHFHKMLKSIKKKDSIELFIDSRNSTDLGIKVVPREKNRITNSTVKIQTIQNTYMELPKGYDKPVIVPSIEYQKMCKDMNNIGNTIRVISKGFQVEFKCNTANVYSRGTLFGEIGDEDDDDDDEDFEDQVEYDQDFDTEQLTRIIKIAGLSSNMQIYPKEGLPLLFKSLVGSLGTIAIYIKSKKEIEKDENEYERGDSDYED